MATLFTGATVNCFLALTLSRRIAYKNEYEKHGDGSLKDAVKVSCCFPLISLLGRRRRVGPECVFSEPIPLREKAALIQCENKITNPADKKKRRREREGGRD